MITELYLSTGLIVPDDAYPGIYECIGCGGFTSGESHFYADRATGAMKHQADLVQRAIQAAQCGWTFFDDFAGQWHRCYHQHNIHPTEQRPRLSRDEVRVHQSHGMSWTERMHGAKAPALP